MLICIIPILDSGSYFYFKWETDSFLNSLLINNMNICVWVLRLCINSMFMCKIMVGGQFFLCFLRLHFCPETAGTEKGEVHSALGEMDASVRGTHRVMLPSKLTTPKICPLIHSWPLGLFMAKMLHKLIKLACTWHCSFQRCTRVTCPYM